MSTFVGVLSLGGPALPSHRTAGLRRIPDEFRPIMSKFHKDLATSQQFYLGCVCGLTMVEFISQFPALSKVEAHK